MTIGTAAAAATLGTTTPPTATPPAGGGAAAGAPAASPAGSDAPAGTAQDTPKPGDQTGGTQNPGTTTPQAYDWKLPEGVGADDPLVSGLEPLAREMGLTSEHAQKALDFAFAQREAVSDQLASEWKSRVETWKADIAKDAEIGGPDSAQKIAVGIQVLERFGTPELREFLGQGFGNHPEVARLLYRVGKEFADGTHVGGTNAPPQPTEAQQLAARFPKMAEYYAGRK